MRNEDNSEDWAPWKKWLIGSLLIGAVIGGTWAWAAIAVRLMEVAGTP